MQTSARVSSEEGRFSICLLNRSLAETREKIARKISLIVAT